MANEPDLNRLLQFERQMELWNRYEKKPDLDYIFKKPVDHVPSTLEHQKVTNSPVHLISPPQAPLTNGLRPRAHVLVILDFD